jgi:hypothetical protein
VRALRTPRERVWFVLAVLVVVSLQVGLFAYFGGARLFSDQPHAGLDFDTHITQAYRVIEGLERWKRSWVYDVQLLAGAPNGVIFDADNKGWSLVTYAGKQLGLSPGFSFNLFIIVAHAGVVPLVYAGARLLRVGPWGSLLAAALGVLYWNFDSWTHWCWYVGMVAYALASLVFLLPLGFFYRWSEERKAWHLAATAVSLALAHLVHPYSFFILVFPMTALYLRSASSIGWRGHVGVLGVVACVLAVNAYWLLEAARFWHYILDSSLFATTGPKNVLWDALNVVVEPASTGFIGMRAVYRNLLVLTGFVTIGFWWRRGDPRTLPLGGMLVTLLVFGYVGGVTPLAQTQPYRNLLPAGFLGCILTGALVEYAVRRQVFARFSRGARWTTRVLLCALALLLAHEAKYYFVESLPKPSMLPDGAHSPMWSTGYRKHVEYRYEDWHADHIAAWVREHDDGSGRFLVESWSMGEQLAWKTDAQIMGGFIWRNLQHSWSNFFRRRPQGIASPQEIERYFKDYAIHWVIVFSSKNAAPWWDRVPSLEKVTELGGVRVYRVRNRSRLIVKGPGRVAASTNEIRVFGTDPSRPVVLRYHWMETLRCIPDCSVERSSLKGDPVGFIRIPAGHARDFVVFNKYAFPN